MTQSWSGGYIADVAYVEGFYLQQSPALMTLACLLGNVDPGLVEPDDDAGYLELGCGYGIGALLTAASNPGWQVTAVDYNPAHIAMARGLARAARIENIQFIEADLSQLAGSALSNAIPPAHFVTMHGLWSWVGKDVRAGIVRLLAEKTRPGSLVHVSYNALPAWQGGIGLQRIIYEAGIRSAGRSDRQAAAGMALAKAMKDASGKYLIESPVSRDIIDRSNEMSNEYLSHEFMGAHWSPEFHADVAAAMAEAKLDWVASANPLENFPELMLAPDQRAVLERYDDPIMRELIKDVCMPRQLRHDVYVRGARRLKNSERDAALSRLTVVPVVMEDELQTALRVPAGTAEMGDSLKSLMAAAMRGPTTIGDLLAREPGKSNPPELVSVLIGSNQCQIAMRPGTVQPDGANRLNRLIGGRIRSLVDAKNSNGLACSTFGTGMPTPPLVQFIAARLLSGEDESHADSWIADLSADVVPEKRDTVRDVVRTAIQQRVPILRRLGLVPG